MPGGYGASKNGVKIGVFWDGILLSSDGSQARITDAHINIDRAVNISDSTNRLSWSGGAVTDGSDSNINVGGSGEKRIKSCSETWVTLNFGSSSSHVFSASFSGVDYAGGTLSVSKTITYPARAVIAPTSPTLVPAGTGRVAGSQQIRVTWVNNPVVPSAPYSALVVERTVNGGAWANVSGDLPSTTTSWVDSQTLTNHYYQYRVSAKNGGGTSAPSAASVTIPTTPPPITSLTLSKVGSNVTLNWAGGSAVWFTGTVIAASRAGVVTSYTVPWSATSWADPDVSAATRQYTLTHYTLNVPVANGSPFTDYSTSVVSSQVQLEAPPDAPTVTLSQSVFDATETAQVISWVHNPVDASAQTQAEVRRRVLPAGGYTTDSKTTQTSHTIAAGVLSNNTTYGVQVRTRGSHVTFGPWSDEAAFTTSTRPTVQVTSPVVGTQIHSAALDITLSFTDPGGSPDAAAWQVVLFQVGVATPVWPDDLNSVLPGTIDDAQYTIGYQLQDATTYEVHVRAQDVSGLWSEWMIYTYEVVFAPPYPGTIISAVCNTATGEVEVNYTVDSVFSPSEFGYGGGDYGDGDYGDSAYTGVSEYLPAKSAVVQRLTDGNWVDLDVTEFNGDPVGVYGYTDPIPPLGGEVTYRIVTRSAIPTSHEGEPFVADCMIPVEQCVYPDGMRILLNAGINWAQKAVIVGSPAVDEPIEREKVLVTPVGRVYPIELIGIAVEEKYSLSGVVARDTLVSSYVTRLGALRGDWAAMAQMPAPICYRDPFGKRIFGSISGVKTDWGTTPISSVSATITRTVGGDALYVPPAGPS